MSLSFLQSLDLSATELALYELLLKLGEVPVAQLIKQSKRKKPTVYKTMYTLTAKGLAETRDVKKILHVKPTSPTNLMDLTEKKYQAMERTREHLKTIMPHLASQFTLSTDQPVVRTYEGIEGIKAIYIDILNEKKPGYSVLQVEDIERELEDWLVTTFSKKRVRQKMPLKAILASGKGANVFVRRDIPLYRYTRTVPAEKFPFAQEVTVYGDKVAFLHYKKGDALIGTIITHPHFAQTMKAWFDLAWEGAEKYKQSV